MNEKLFRDRQILTSAQANGKLATGLAYFRLSGPGWLQSAITLGGGSLGGSLYLGAIGGTGMLWVNLTAITIGVIMLSAISFVTLSTGKRPYQAINEHVNPVLGAGWIGATILANMIFIIAQFSLCYEVAKSNFLLEDQTLAYLGLSSSMTQVLFSALLAMIALAIVVLSFRPGWMSKLFDWLLKGLVGLVVVSFLMAIINLTRDNALDWTAIGWGMLPDPMTWLSPVSSMTSYSDGLDSSVRSFWEDKLVQNQRKIMIGAAATAVGINMTFLLPYSMLARGWDRTFRGFARWDLMTGMAIPFVLVTMCITIASAHAFHGKIDEQFASQDPVEFQQSPLFRDSPDTQRLLKERIIRFNPQAFPVPTTATDSNAGSGQRAETSGVADSIDRELSVLAALAAALPDEEKRIAVSLARPNTKQLAATLEPVLGQQSNLVFGLGAFGMGFSTIIVLMLINSYAIAEIFHCPDDNRVKTAGGLLAAIAGFCWLWIWTGSSRTWLIILASNFAAILLPIAYLTFFLMLNNRSLMGDDRPAGLSRWIWNGLMLIGILGAAIAAYASVCGIAELEIRYFIFGGVAIFLLLAIIGFSTITKSVAKA